MVFVCVLYVLSVFRLGDCEESWKGKWCGWGVGGGWGVGVVVVGIWGGVVFFRRCWVFCCLGFLDVEVFVCFDLVFCFLCCW